MRYLNNQEIVIRNRHSLESIEVTRGNTATPLSTLSTANSAKRRPTAPTFTAIRLYAYVPSNRINLGLLRWQLLNERFPSLQIDWIAFYAVSAIFQPCNGGDY